MNPAIYHITHLDNLAGILSAGCLYSDTKRREGVCEAVEIGYAHIKDRRTRRPVPTAAQGVLADYVPFYFCPRSVMLHSIWKGLVQGYAGGQQRVVHLVSSVESAVDLRMPWTFTDSHAEPIGPPSYFEDLSDLDKLNWPILKSWSWGGDQKRPYKQAEFLVHERFDWSAVEQIGVIDQAIKAEVEAVMANAQHHPPVVVQRDWYYH